MVVVFVVVTVRPETREVVGGVRLNLYEKDVVNMQTEESVKSEWITQNGKREKKGKRYDEEVEEKKGE